MTPDEEIAQIKRDTFDQFKDSPQVWILEERGAEFIIHAWNGTEYKHGAGVGPTSSYPMLRKAAARLLQLFHCGPVAPQTWPEEACIIAVTMDEQS